MNSPDELFKKIKMLETLAKMPLSSPHPVVSMDLSGILLFRNQAYTQFIESLGPEAAQVRAKLFDYCGMAFRERRNLTSEVIFGERYFLLSAVPDFSDSSTVFYLIETTTQKQLESDLQEASRLFTLGELTGSIAHEINNPLNIIKANAYLIEKSVGDEKATVVADAQKRALKIKEMVDRIAVIIKTLKGFSRKQSVENKKMVSLVDVFKMTEELIQIRTKGNAIKMSFDVDPRLQLYASEIPLSQVFINLLNNSLDAIEDGSEAWIKVTAKRDAGSIIIEVQDSGLGIPEKVREQLFRKTITTKEVGKGTGLGLRITKQIIEAFGGSIQIDPSRANTCFLISFPDIEVLSTGMVS